MLYFKLVATLMQGITNNFAPHNILRGLFNTTRIKYMFITTLDPCQEVITKLNFQDWINKASHFHDWGPQYGIAYLRILEKSQNMPLKRKYMIAYLKSVLSQTDFYPDLPTLSYQDKCNAKSSLSHPLIIFAIILIVYL